MKALVAGGVYAALAFAAGFVFGVLRTLIVAPLTGPLGAVLIEAPLMLGVSWMLCRWTMRRFAVPAELPVRIAAGAVAFVALMALEAGQTLALGRRLADMLAGFATAAGAVGLAAQIVFALLPVVQIYVARSTSVTR